jgi:nucleotide-binding universal stress UspA family protein
MHMSATLSRIVAATDFSADAGNAVRRSALLARLHRVELELLHVMSSTSLDAVREWVKEPAGFADRLVDDARSSLQEAAASTGVPASARVELGDVLSEIVASCAQGRILAVGARGLNPLRDTILGTTAERLVGRAECPILVVRKPPEGDYRNVLAAVDLLEGSETVLSMAAAIAPGASIAAVHAYDVPFEGALQRAGVASREIDQYRAAAFRKALNAVRGISANLAGEPGRFFPIVEHGYPARLILKHEQALGADLLIIGKRSHSAVEALILGSTTRHVLADAGCDVLIVPLAR